LIYTSSPQLLSIPRGGTLDLSRASFHDCSLGSWFRASALRASALDVSRNTFAFELLHRIVGFVRVLTIAWAVKAEVLLGDWLDAFHEPILFVGLICCFEAGAEVAIVNFPPPGRLPEPVA
jgi:hypothetical protein